MRALTSVFVLLALSGCLQKADTRFIPDGGTDGSSDGASHAASDDLPTDGVEVTPIDTTATPASVLAHE